MGPSILVLGPVEVRTAAGVVAVPGVKLQALLAMLALAVPRAVSADRLIEELWGDEQPSNPANALQAQVSHLRRLLGRDLVARRGAGYVLDVAPEDVDVGRLEQLTAAAREAAEAGDLRGAAQHHRAALALARGPVLATLGDFPFAREAAGRLEESLLLVQEGLADVELAAGRHLEVVGRLTELVREHPLRERFAAQLITALYRSGRQVDALRVYAQVREALIEEVGVEPGHELRELERAVLAHDPALAAPRSAMAAPAHDPTATGPVEADPEAPAGRPDAGDAFRNTLDRMPLTGREAELELLGGDLADVLVGRGRVVVLAGEPGIGKTRMAEELAYLAEQRGAIVGWGRSHDGVGGGAFWSWSRVVRTLIERVPPEVMADALGRGAGAIAQVVPEVHDLIPDLAEPPPLDPESARFRLFDAFTTALRNLARSRPVLITLDDVQWADAASLQLLGFLSREITDVRVLVVITYRNVGATTGSVFHETLAMLMRQPIVRRVDLEGLPLEALGELVQAAGAEASAEVLATVHRRTQGNPFFAVELLRLLPRTRTFTDVDAMRQAIPNGVRDVIRQRLGLLPADTRDVLSAAAVLGSEFEVATLAVVLGTSGTDLLEHLQPALDAGIVVGTDGIADFRFSHGLVNETVYADLPAATKARLHLQVAQALEQLQGAADGPVLVELATHWARSLPAGPPVPAIRYALRAARWTEDHLAHEQAESLLSMALELVARVPAGPERDTLELAVQDQLSLVQIVTAGYASEQVVRASARMRELCLAIDDQALLVPALWRLAIYATIGTELDTARDLGEQLLALEGPDQAGTGPALAGHLALGASLTHRGDLEEAWTHLEAARQLLEAGHGDELAAVIAEGPAVWCGVFSAWNTWLRGDEAEAERRVLATLAVAEAARAPYGTTFATWFSVLIATLRQDPEAVLARCERGLPAAIEHGFGMFVPYMIASRGWALAVQGDLDLGGDELLGAAGAIKASGARMMRHVFPALHADACLMLGRHALALASAEEGIDEVERTGERWYEAELHRLRGMALAGLDPSDPEAVVAVRTAGEVAERQGAVTLARRAEASLVALGGVRGGEAAQPSSGTIS